MNIFEETYTANKNLSENLDKRLISESNEDGNLYFINWLKDGDFDYIANTQNIIIKKDFIDKDEILDSNNDCEPITDFSVIKVGDFFNIDFADDMYDEISYKVTKVSPDHIELEYIDDDFGID